MSPKSVSTPIILRAVREESLGFRFGKPDRPSDTALACLLPILRETSYQRQYVTYGETDRILVSDSGSISRLNVKNTGPDNVFLRSGTMFDGKGTQSRALTRSAVIFPGQEVALDVRCIHASHGIQAGSGFAYGGVTPLSMDSAFYGSGYRPADQQTMWRNVETFTNSISSPGVPLRGGERIVPRYSRLNDHDRPGRIQRATMAAGRGVTTNYGGGGTSSAAFPVFNGRDGLPGELGQIGSSSGFGAGSDDLRAHFDHFASSFAAVLSKARLHDHQAGIALITDRGCQTIELFDVPVSWEALHKDAVTRMGTELLRGPDETNVFEYKPERAVDAARKVLGLDYAHELIWEHKPANGEPHVAIYGLTAQPYVGEAVEIGGDVAHLVLLRTA